MKKALIYDPYLDTMGGGERYALTFARVLADNGYDVDVAWSDKTIKQQAASRFNLDLTKIEINPSAFEDLTLSSGLIKRFRRTKLYDLTFWVSDGSLPFLFSRKNLIHFQVPFTNIGGTALNNLLKSTLATKFIFNSVFTSKIIMQQLPLISSTVLYPPIDTDSFTAGKKENIILSVARFDSPSHAKRHDILIDIFIKLHEKNKTFHLILAGGLKGGEEFIKSLKDKAGKLPVEFIPNPDFDKLKELYAKAKIFWHTAGYSIDEVAEPEKVEHFGITTVEAMSAGAVPVVINKGGQREIITGESGYLCDSIEEMTQSTLSLIDSPQKLKLMSEKAVDRSKAFSVSVFEKKIISIIS